MTSATTLRHRLLARVRMRHLQVFVQVAELGSVRRAADAIGLTQPAVTQTLADIEELLECKLFLRHARGMRTSAAGATLLPLARRILAAMDESADQITVLAGLSSKVVRVAAIAAAVSGLLAHALPRFFTQHPDIHVRVEEADAVQQAAMVEKADVDLALCRSPAVVPEGWSFQPLLEDCFVIVAAPDHPLAARERIGLDELQAQLWLAAPVGTAARTAMDELFHEGRQPRLRNLSTRSTSLMWSMLTYEPMLLLIPRSFARQFVENGLLAELRFAALPFKPLGLLLPNAELGEGARCLVDHLTREAAEAFGGSTPTTKSA